MSGTTAQGKSWKAKEAGDEAQYVRQKEAEQLAAIRHDQASKQEESTNTKPTESPFDRDFEGGFGGQEDLEDRYATTCGEH